MTAGGAEEELDRLFSRYHNYLIHLALSRTPLGAALAGHLSS